MKRTVAALSLLALAVTGVAAAPVRTAAQAVAIAGKQCTPTRAQGAPAQWQVTRKGELWIAVLGKPDAAGCPLSGAEISRHDGRVVCTVCFPRTDRR